MYPSEDVFYVEGGWVAGEREGGYFELLTTTKRDYVVLVHQLNSTQQRQSQLVAQYRIYERSRTEQL